MVFLRGWGLFVLHGGHLWHPWSPSGSGQVFASLGGSSALWTGCVSGVGALRWVSLGRDGNTATKVLCSLKMGQYFLKIFSNCWYWLLYTVIKARSIVGA